MSDRQNVPRRSAPQGVKYNARPGTGVQYGSYRYHAPKRGSFKDTKRADKLLRNFNDEQEL